MTVGLTDVDPGTHEITVACGDRSFTDTVDVVGQTVQSAAASGGSSAAAAVLLFFLLSGYLVLRRV